MIDIVSSNTKDGLHIMLLIKSLSTEQQKKINEQQVYIEHLEAIPDGPVYQIAKKQFETTAGIIADKSVNASDIDSLDSLNE